MNLPALDRLAPTRRPAGSAIGYQRWSDLLFVHWRFPAEAVAACVPPSLTLDTWEGEAWVGLVLFRMSGVRPWWSCSLPWLSAFPETNLRTYVHFQGREPGVWFFSLEAANPVAVAIARWLWTLPYHWARMTIDERERTIRYASRRRRPGPAVGTTVAADLAQPAPAQTVRSALPETLDHFLVERYVLYSQDAQGRLWRGQVHHRPYPLEDASLTECDENLCQAAGLPAPAAAPAHVTFSRGVAVEIFPLVPLDASSTG
jgi:hypothetical protein